MTVLVGLFYYIKAPTIKTLINPNWPGRFCKFSKNLIKNFKKLISPTTRTRETNYSAFERSGIGLSFCSGEPLSPRAPFSRILASFSGTVRGLVITTEYYEGLLDQELLWKGMWLVFSIDQRLLRKLDFAKNWILEKYTHFLCKRKPFSQIWRHSLFLVLVPFKSI